MKVKEIPDRLQLMLQELADKADNNCEQDADNDHRGYWKIKAEILLFNPYIARQAADPV